MVKGSSRIFPANELASDGKLIWSSGGLSIEYCGKTLETIIVDGIPRLPPKVWESRFTKADPVSLAHEGLCKGIEVAHNHTCGMT